MDKFERELALEAEMVGLGANRVWKEILGSPASDNKKPKKGLREKEEESRSRYGRELISSALEPFIAEIKDFLEVKGAGRRHSAVAILKQFQPEVVAFITLQSVIDSITKRKKRTLSAWRVGKCLEDELRFAHFEKTNQAFWEKLKKDLTRREHNMKRRRAILIHEMKKGAKKQRSMRWDGWSDELAFHVGSKCVELLEKSTGLVKTRVVGRGADKYDALEATEETLAWVKEQMDNAGVLAPMFLPTIIPPRRWVSPMRGGYHLKTLKPLKLVKVYGPRGKNYIEELANRTGSMSLVYRAINAVQDTPWRVNTKILAVMQQAWKARLSVGDMPSTGEIPLPPKPVDIATNDEARLAWSRKASRVWTERARQSSRVIQMDRLLWLAEKFAPEEAIYFPMQLDFRERMYAVPSFLNPQGNDPAKSLLMFARGRRLGSGGLRWLKIHLANCWGEDKVGFEDRVKWTEQHEHEIRSYVAAPFEHRGWMDADKPWQFLAACMEYVDANGDENYFAHIPPSVDGTCNGLQHLSAMLRDHNGAEAVNLTPSELPQDIYQRVADKVRARLEEEAAEGVQFAKDWLAWGFNRKATKRAVMIVPYSGTLFSAKDYTIDHIQERNEKGDPCPWEDQFAPAMYFAKHVWAAISETVVSAKQAMQWLRAVAKVVTKSGSSLDWVTPVGFPVKQDYREWESYRIKTRLGNSIAYMPRFCVETQKFDQLAQEQGISPNFVHSLDAACLTLTVCRALDEGIRDFAMVHDSYGVPAGDMDLLYVGLRDCFVDIYQNDVLADFYRTATSSLKDEELAKIPPQPPRGGFQLEAVKESKYFFA
jgi:DNA-directed RNA polymerase